MKLGIILTLGVVERVHLNPTSQVTSAALDD